MRHNRIVQALLDAEINIGESARTPRVAHTRRPRDAAAATDRAAPRIGGPRGGPTSGGRETHAVPAAVRARTPRDPHGGPGGAGTNLYTLLPLAFGLLFSFVAASYITKLAKKALEDAGADAVE